MKNNRIRLHADFMNQIADEQGVTLQTVRMSLQYVFNSDKAKAIRVQARQLLQSEAQKVENEEMELGVKATASHVSR